MVRIQWISSTGALCFVFVADKGRGRGHIRVKRHYSCVSHLRTPAIRRWYVGKILVVFFLSRISRKKFDWIPVYHINVHFWKLNGTLLIQCYGQIRPSEGREQWGHQSICYPSWLCYKGSPDNGREGASPFSHPLLPCKMPPPSPLIEDMLMPPYNVAVQWQTLNVNKPTGCNKFITW